jgi:hypothetical protein
MVHRITTHVRILLSIVTFAVIAIAAEAGQRWGTGGG